MTLRAERKKQQRRIAAALAVSLLIHLLILCAALLILSLDAGAPKKETAKNPAPEPIELTIVPPPTPTPPPEKKFFDSADGQLSEKPPEDAAFESDRDTVASSRLPAQSDEPLPTTEGTDDPGLSLVARDLSLGPGRQASPPSPQAPASPPQTSPETQTKPQPTPSEKPEDKPTPTPKPTPKPTPTATPRPEDSELAMLDPSRPRPEPPRPQQPKPSEQPPSRPSTPQTPGYQPQSRVTRLTGGISSGRDRDSVAAMATPLGRYNKQISDAIGSRWYYYVNEALSLVNVGTVKLRFTVRQDGRVDKVQVLSNSSNESLASCSVQAVVAAEIPPMPREVAAALAGSRLEIDYSFTIVGR